MNLANLYRELILDHNKTPHHFGRLSDATHSAEGYNPVCGDHYRVDLRVKDGRIQAASFEGSGCAISKASASMMTDFVLEKTVEEAKDAMLAFQAFASRAGEQPLSESLQAFSGVHEFPARIKCATLAWHALKAALEKKA